MPRLMEKTDWIQTVADVGIAENVWYENIVGDADSVSFPLPERGRYRVILVKLEGDLNPRPISCSKQKRKISPRVRALRGAARANINRDYKDMLADALAERYEDLGFGMQCGLHHRKICWAARGRITCKGGFVVGRSFVN